MLGPVLCKVSSVCLFPLMICCFQNVMCHLPMCVFGGLMIYYSFYKFCSNVTNGGEARSFMMTLNVIIWSMNNSPTQRERNGQITGKQNIM